MALILIQTAVSTEGILIRIVHCQQVPLLHCLSLPRAEDVSVQASKQEAKAYTEIALSLGIQCSQGSTDLSMLAFLEQTAPGV